jgi:hypothetical protein
MDVTDGRITWQTKRPCPPSSAPWSLGTACTKNTNAVVATPAYRKKHPGMVIQSASEMNVMLTNPHASRFTAFPRLAP